MTIPVLMTSPTVLMEETLFHVLEGLQGAKVETALTDPVSEGTALAMRVAVAAHGILQAAYAVLAVVPVCLATAITVFRQGCITGFSGSTENAFVRLCEAVQVAVKTLLYPVVNTVRLIANIRSLHEEGAGMPEMISTPLALSLLTMPLISELDQGLASHETLENRIMSTPSYQESAEMILRSVESKPDASTSLVAALDRDAFYWRFEICPHLAENMKDELPSIASFHKLFYPTQEQLRDAIGPAIQSFGLRLAEPCPEGIGS